MEKLRPKSKLLASNFLLIFALLSSGCEAEYFTHGYQTVNIIELGSDPKKQEDLFNTKEYCRIKFTNIKFYTSLTGTLRNNRPYPQRQPCSEKTDVGQIWEIKGDDETPLPLYVLIPGKFIPDTGKTYTFMGQYGEINQDGKNYYAAYLYGAPVEEAN